MLALCTTDLGNLCDARGFSGKRGVVGGRQPPNETRGPRCAFQAPPPADKGEATAEAEAGKNRMKHCPSAVKGAKTEARKVDGGMELTITGKGAKEIQKRAAYLVELSEKRPAPEQAIGEQKARAKKHSGAGEFGGGVGYCPVVMKDTTLETRKTPKGVVVVLKATRAGDADALQKIVRERLARLPSLLKE